MDLNNSIEETLNQIQEVMNTNSIIGTPITTADKTIIPISKTALGFGVGVGKYDGNSDTELGGAGGGGSIDPVAFIIIYNNIPGPDGVEILPVEGNDTPLEDLLMGVGKLIFDLIGSRNAEPAGNESVDDSTDNNVNDMKTKIKTDEE